MLLGLEGVPLRCCPFYRGGLRCLRRRQSEHRTLALVVLLSPAGWQVGGLILILCSGRRGYPAPTLRWGTRTRRTTSYQRRGLLVRRIETAGLDTCERYWVRCVHRLGIVLGGISNRLAGRFLSGTGHWGHPCEWLALLLVLWIAC